MNILITGINGFIGKNIFNYYKNQGHHIIGVGNINDKDTDDFKGIKLINSSISFKALETINEEIDLVINCAGSGSVGYSLENPFNDFEKNVISLSILLEYIKKKESKTKIIHLSSASVYGDHGDCPILETDKLNPVSPYGYHKVMSENLCESYSLNFGLSIGIIRLFSVYGNGIRKQLLWDACGKLNNNSGVFFGTGMEERDWIHVDDVANLIDIFQEQLQGFDVINGGTGIATSIETIVKCLSKEINPNIELIFNGKVREGDPKYLVSNDEKARKLGWESKIDVFDGLIEYTKWVKALKC